MLLIKPVMLTPYIPILLTNSDSSGCFSERSHVPIRSQGKVFLCGGTESTYNTVAVNVGPVGSVGCDS